MSWRLTGTWRRKTKIRRQVTISAAIMNGRISNLLDAVSGLNGGKALTLLVGGDRDIAVRCGAVAFDISKGKGTSTLFVVDTEQTQIIGNGGFDLDHERFDMKIEPKPTCRPIRRFEGLEFSNCLGTTNVG
jgi:uncharacterized protein involved in outer membrane biogenesis